MAGEVRQLAEKTALATGDIELANLDQLSLIERPHTAVHEQGQAAIDAHQQNALESALDHLGRMEAANLEVMRIVRAVLEQYQHSVA